MKTLLLIRHAKSSWASPDQQDFDRPLNDRGKSDAPMMAERLFQKKTPIDVFISSPAKRAKKTCEYFTQQYERSTDQIIFKPELYLAEPSVFWNVVEQIDNTVHHAAIVSHNNGITDFANQLTDTKIDDMPTCAVFAVNADASNWQDFKKAKKTFLFFDYPKLM